MKYVLIFCLIIITPSLFATPVVTIQEIIYFEQIEKFVDNDTLVILDLDDTIQIPVQTIGNDRWFYEYYSRELKSGVTHEVALDTTIKQYDKIHKLSRVKPVESVTPGIIRSMQNRGIHVIALTARGMNIADATIRQLNSINVSFNNESFKDINNGIIFCSGRDKGQCLLAYLKQLGWSPLKIVFVDDKIKNLHDVATVVKGLGIKYYGLHYTHLDTHLANQQHNIDLNIADVQLRHLDEILNDEAATLLYAHYSR